MRTAYISHRECRQHDTGADHPEHARRLSAIEDQLASTGLFDVLRYVEAPEATDGQLLRVHTREHLDAMAAMATPVDWTFRYTLLMFFMWWVMMIAMMLPSAAPMILLHARVERSAKARAGEVGVFPILLACGRHSTDDGL